MARASNRQTRALDIAKEIAELELRIAPIQARLSALKLEFKRLVPPDEIEPESDNVVPITSSRATLVERVMEVLSAEPTREFSADDLATRLQAKTPSLRSTLQRLHEHQKIQRAGRGAYIYNSEQPPVPGIEEVMP